MTEQRKTPVVALTPEQIEQLNESFRRIAEQARAAAQAFGRAYAKAIPTMRESLARIDASDFKLTS